MSHVTLFTRMCWPVNINKSSITYVQFVIYSQLPCSISSAVAASSRGKAAICKMKKQATNAKIVSFIVIFNKLTPFAIVSAPFIFACRLFCKYCCTLQIPALIVIVTSWGLYFNQLRLALILGMFRLISGE
jgi:hypothetical protein